MNIFLFSLFFSRNKAGDRVVRILQDWLVHLLKKCFLDIYYMNIDCFCWFCILGFCFYCMRLIVMVMLMCPWSCPKNFIYCVSNPYVLQGSWNSSHVMVEKLNHWLNQGQNCWSLQSEDSDPCLFLLCHNSKGQPFFLWYIVLKGSGQNVINKKVKNELVWLFQIDMH